MKPKEAPKQAEIRAVRKEDKHSELPDLHYTAIVTLNPIDALLIAAGLVVEYETPIRLLRRRQHAKLYLRAGASVTRESYLQFKASDSDLYQELLAQQASLQKRMTASIARVQYDNLIIPVNCLVGYCYPTIAELNVWSISKASLLSRFYPLAGRGGIYFTRQLELEALHER